MGSIVPITLAASAIISILALMGIYLVPITPTITEADMFISPSSKTLSVQEEFSVTVNVSATVPVNAFTGTILFNREALEVISIDYNTSVADLWTEEPWYKNGEGTIGFAGGTTNRGGFTGSDILMTIIFKAIAPGDGNVWIQNARVLEHDGSGTDADVSPFESVYFTVSTSTSRAVVEKNTSPIDVQIMSETRTTDLNNDGKVTLADLSMFMLFFTSGNRQADFNGDGSITTADLNILLQSL